MAEVGAESEGAFFGVGEDVLGDVVAWEEDCWRRHILVAVYLDCDDVRMDEKVDIEFDMAMLRRFFGDLAGGQD